MIRVILMCCMFLLLFPACKKDEPTTPATNPFVGTWHLVLAGSYTGNANVSIASDGSFSFSILLSGSGGSFTNTITGSVSSSGSVSAGIYEGGSKIGTVSGTLSGNGGSGTYQTSEPSSGTWSATRTVTQEVTYSGKTYHTVQIGNQIWLKENLDVGTMIQGIDTAKNNGTIEKYCYNNDTANCTSYGGLYQWDEAMQYSPTAGAQGICPPGWHIPTVAEFMILKNTVDSNGNALKAVGQGTGAGVGTNTSGFSALLAGNRHPDGNFSIFGANTFLWSSTWYNTTDAFNLTMDSDNSLIYLLNNLKVYGFSVRCIKD